MRLAESLHLYGWM